MMLFERHLCYYYFFRKDIKDKIIYVDRFFHINKRKISIVVSSIVEFMSPSPLYAKRIIYYNFYNRLEYLRRAA